MQLKCKYAERYKGARAPKCDCLMCRMIWLQKQMDRLNAALDLLEHERSQRLAGYPGYD